MKAITEKFRPHCDYCGWDGEWGRVDDMEWTVDAPCPECGEAPLLNPEEWENAKAMQEMIDAVNGLVGDVEEQPTVSVRANIKYGRQP